MSNRRHTIFEQTRAAGTMEQLRPHLKSGDLRELEEISKKSGMNNGKGYSYSYIVKVVRGDHHCPPITKLAKDYLEWRTLFIERAKQEAA